MRRLQPADVDGVVTSVAIDCDGAEVEAGTGEIADDLDCVTGVAASPSGVRLQGT
jgi:hypothetical protein